MLVKPQLELKKRVLSQRQQAKRNFSYGCWAESLVCEYLQNNGYEIIARNCVVGRFELDIIAQDLQHDELVFIEVKARKNSYHGSGADAVNGLKLKKLVTAGAQYVRYKRITTLYRFDIIAVTGGRVEHFENVTW